MSAPVIVTLTTNKPGGVVEGDTFDIDIAWSDADAETLTFQFKVTNDASGAESAPQTISIPVTDPSQATYTQTAGTAHTLALVSSTPTSAKFRGTA